MSESIEKKLSERDLIENDLRRIDNILRRDDEKQVMIDMSDRIFLSKRKDEMSGRLRTLINEIEEYGRSHENDS